MFQIEYPSYRVNENTKTPIMVKRLGGTKGEATVQFQVNPGSAWQDHFNADGNMELKFADGQTERKLMLRQEECRERQAIFPLLLFLQIRRTERLSDSIIRRQ